MQKPTSHPSNPDRTKPDQTAVPQDALILRLATETDMPALQALIELSARVLGAHYYSAPQLEQALDQQVLGLDRQLIIDQTYYVVEYATQIVGCGGWSKRNTLFGGDQSKAGSVDPLLDPSHDPARIRAFFIHPEWSLT